MNGTKLKRFSEQVRRFGAQFAQSGQELLGKVIPLEQLQCWVDQEVGAHRERVYGPLRTLMLFIEQVLNTDHSCQDAVARGVSEQAGMGQAASSLNTGPYCKARQRLPLALIERLGREIGQRLSASQPAGWKWRGREVKLVDGTTVSMPDTVDNRGHFAQNKAQKKNWDFRWRGWWRWYRYRVRSYSIGRWGPMKARVRARPHCCWSYSNNSSPGMWWLPIVATRLIS
jgi:hypothetical protein